MKYLIFIFLSFTYLSLSSQTQASEPFLAGDLLPDAPELAARGEHQVGVRTIEVVNKNQVDILSTKDSVSAFYDRDLTLEVWYPASLNPGQKESETYDHVMGSANNEKRPIIPFTFDGRAVRDADILHKEDAYPLIVVSHGYTGSRLLMTYLTENLASKGYVVAAIDHKESTYKDAAGFQSTLLNRPKDILFVVDQLSKLASSEGHFLAGLVDVQRTGIVGYSMGGYGVLNVGGAGYSEQLLDFFGSMTGGNKSIADLIWNNEDYTKSFDERIKAIVAFAPWGMERGVWDADGLKGLKIPTFIVAGSQDDVSGYEKGVKAIFEGAINVERYMLTYMNARHNVAPNPPPPETLRPGLNINEYYRYAEPAWSEKRINNINQHFVTAFLGMKLKGEDHTKFLQLDNVESNEKNWEGFKPRTSVGLKLSYAKPDE